MSELLETIQKQHQDKLDQLQRDEVDEAFLDGVQLLIADLRQAGAVVANPAERGQLRALMRFWGSVVYDHTGVYPDTTLQPIDPGRAQPEEEPPPSSAAPPAWLLVGGAAVLVIASVFIGSYIAPTPQPPPTPAVTPSAVPVFARIQTGDRLTAEGGLARSVEVFCWGTPQIVAELTLERIRPEAMWHWEVWHEGEEVARQQEEPWGRSGNRVTLPVLTGGSDGVEPGRYELRVYVNDQVVETRVFRVLDKAPRISSLRLSDVPEPTDEASGRQAFDVGLRVVYLTYEYEGMCPGLELVHALYREGKPVQRSERTWEDPSEGQMQISLQAPGEDEPFPPGDYDVVLTLEGEEEAREQFTIEEEPPEVRPTFSDVTIAQGVQADGTPILKAPDNRFDWNTKVVYAVFDYKGMSDGVEWSGVWMRGGEEVARQGGFWDEEAFGAQGRRWIAYYDERNQGLLPSGSYSVTLYIEGVPQQTAEFNILFYVPSQ